MCENVDFLRGFGGILALKLRFFWGKLLRYGAKSERMGDFISKYGANRCILVIIWGNLGENGATIRDVIGIIAQNLLEMR